VARECPDVPIVLDHFGGPLGVGPYKRDEVFPGWRADIKALSACPNPDITITVARLMKTLSPVLGSDPRSGRPDLQSRPKCE
jgi:hypothetical protein